MKFIFGLISSKIIRQARKRGVEYSFLFLHPDGHQLAEIGKLLDAGHILPVIDKVFPFDQTKEALAYLEEGRVKGKVVVKIIWSLLNDFKYSYKNDSTISVDKLVSRMGIGWLSDCSG